MGEEAGRYEGCGGGVDAGFALGWGVSEDFGGGGEGRGKVTWPPEKPTATTPSSLFVERNFGAIVEGDVILKEVERVEGSINRARRAVAEHR